MKYLTEESVYEIMSFNEGEKLNKIKTGIKNSSIALVILAIIKILSKKISILRQKRSIIDNKINNLKSNQNKYPLTIEMYIDINNFKQNSVNEIRNFTNQKISEIYSIIDKLMNESNDNEYWDTKNNKEIEDGTYNNIDNLFKTFDDEFITHMIYIKNNNSIIKKKFKSREEAIQFLINIRNKALEYENLMNEINRNIVKLKNKAQQCDKINDDMKLFVKSIYIKRKISKCIDCIEGSILDIIEETVNNCLDDMEDILSKIEDKEYDFYEKKPSEISIPNESCMINIV